MFSGYRILMKHFHYSVTFWSTACNSLITFVCVWDGGVVVAEFQVTSIKVSHVLRCNTQKTRYGKSQCWGIQSVNVSKSYIRKTKQTMCSC